MKLLLALASFVATFLFSLFCAPLRAWRQAGEAFHLCICDSCRAKALAEMRRRKALREREE